MTGSSKPLVLCFLTLNIQNNLIDQLAKIDELAKIDGTSNIPINGWSIIGLIYNLLQPFKSNNFNQP